MFCAVVATYRCIQSLCFDVNFWLLGVTMCHVTSVDMCTMVVCVNVKFVKCFARSIVSSACRMCCRDCCHRACCFYNNLGISDVRLNNLSILMLLNWFTMLFLCYIFPQGCWKEVGGSCMYCCIIIIIIRRRRRRIHNFYTAVRSSFWKWQNVSLLHCGIKTYEN